MCSVHENISHSQHLHALLISFMYNEYCVHSQSSVLQALRCRLQKKKFMRVRLKIASKPTRMFRSDRLARKTDIGACQDVRPILPWDNEMVLQVRRCSDW